MIRQLKMFTFVMCLLVSTGARVTAAQEPENAGSDTEIRRGLTAAQMNVYVDELSAADKIVTDLTMYLDGNQMLFDATTSVNQDKKSWIVQLNLNDQQFRAAQKKYKDSYSAIVHRTLTIRGTRYHGVVWAQSSHEETQLQLPDGPIPVSGDRGSDLKPLNDLMLNMLKEHNLPGATLAVGFEQEAVFERGFGYSELDPATPMAPNASMRIASLSKPLTAVGILLLCQDGKLNLDEPALTYLAKHTKGKFDADAAVMADPRWKLVTVRHLLQHSGGTDRDASKDTVFQLPEVSRTLKLRKLGRSNDLVRYQLGKPLDFDPGSKYVYSNIGYCILGRIIEAVSELSYEEFIQQRVLTPFGMTQTRLARTRPQHRADDEVHYYTQKMNRRAAVWADYNERGRDKVELVFEPYGAWDIEVMDSHGGWTSTSADLLRFIFALEDPEKPILNSQWRREMLSRPDFDSKADRSSWYGCGWNVRNLSDDGAATYWHNGLLAGTSALMVHRRDGYSWVVLFNCNTTKNDEQCATVIDPKVHQAVDEAMR